LSIGSSPTPNIEGITVDLVPKLMWCEVLGGIKYVLSCSSKLELLSFEVYFLM